MTNKADSRFAPARASLQDTEKRLESLLRKPVASSEPPPQQGRVVGDVVVSTSEEQLIASLVDLRETVRPMPEKVAIVLDFIEQLLRGGELKFTRSQTHATKVTR